MKLTVTSLPKYGLYKNIESNWLKEIPNDWAYNRLGIYFNERRTKVSDKDYAALSVTKNGILPQLENAAKTNDGDNRKLVKQGDFVINSRSDRKGSSGLSFYNGSVSLINIVIQPKDINSSYCHYLLKSYGFIEEFYRVGHGIVADLWTTRYDEMKKITIAMPSEIEQMAIANFLDKKTDQIDKAIAIKEQQIARLKEYQQITIQKAVTQGLNLNVAKKDTGIEWIGKIPKHWELFPMKRIAKLSPKIDLTIYKLDDLVTFLPMEKVSVDGEIICDIKQPIKVVNKGFTPFQKGDVIVAKITPCFENGKSALLNSLDTPIGFGSTEFYVLRPTKLIIDKFLYYIIKSPAFLKQGEGMMIGSAGQKRVPSSFISNFLVALPKTDEQKEIVNYIETESNKIEKAIELKQLQIEKLKEYKTTLINSAVTGKIKVV